MFRSSGGTIFNEGTGDRIEFERAGDVYILRANTPAKVATGTGGSMMPMGFERPRGLRKAHPATPGKVLVLSSESEVEQHELTH